MAIARKHRIGSWSRVLAVAMAAFVGLITIVPAPAQENRAGNREVVAVRELKLKPGADINEFEQFVTRTYNPAWAAAVPGMRGYIAKGDRGVRKDGYALILIFDTETTRNSIFPKAGSGASEQFAPLLQKPFALNEDLDKYIEPGTLSAYTDYVALR